MAVVNPIYTFAQATTELQLRLGNRSDLGSRIATWLNSAQIRMAAAVIACEELDVLSAPLVTVAGQSVYDLQAAPTSISNIIGIKSIRNDTLQVRMRWFPWTEFRELNQQAPGGPLRMAMWGYTIAVDPQPENPNESGPYTLLIDYRREPTRGVTDIPNRFQEDWIAVAEWIAWRALMKPDRAQAALSLTPQSLQTLVQNPLDMEQWNSMWNTDLAVRPLGFDWPWLIGG